MKTYSKCKYSMQLNDLIKLFDNFIDIELTYNNKVEIINSLTKFINDDISLDFSFYVNTKRYTIWHINNCHMLKQYDEKNINGFTNCFEITDRDSEIDLYQLFLFKTNKNYLSYILILFIIYTLNINKQDVLKIINKENCKLK